MTLFLLNNESLEWQVLDWDREDHYQVLEWKDQIRSWRTGMSYQSPLIISQLSNLFFEEWKSVISDASLLMIVPHGVFSGVSFDEFLVDGQMLIEKLPISYQFFGSKYSEKRSFQLGTNQKW